MTVIMLHLLALLSCVLADSLSITWTDSLGGQWTLNARLAGEASAHGTVFSNLTGRITATAHDLLSSSIQDPDFQPTLAKLKDAQTGPHVQQRILDTSDHITNGCGAPQSCDSNGCAGAYDASSNIARCRHNFEGCECIPSQATCGAPQSCNLNGCDGAYNPSSNIATCQGNFKGCVCMPTPTTCGEEQSCDLNGCEGSFNGNSNSATCQNNFKGCPCSPSSDTCGTPQSCDLNGCNGAFNENSPFASCQMNFKGCECIPSAATCGNPQSCQLNGCDGSVDNQGLLAATCKKNFLGCSCTPSFQTPGLCTMIGPCNFADCAGLSKPGTNLGFCTGGSHLGCPCSPVIGTPGAPVNSTGGCNIPGCNNGPPPPPPPLVCLSDCDIIVVDPTNGDGGCACVCIDGRIHGIGNGKIQGASGESCEGANVPAGDFVSATALCSLFGSASDIGAVCSSSTSKS